MTHTNLIRKRYAQNTVELFNRFQPFSSSPGCHLRN